VADEMAQQSVEPPLRRITLAQGLDFLLEGFEGSQAVVLLRKPNMQFVHVSFSERLKKLPVYTAVEGWLLWRFLHPRSAKQASSFRGGSKGRTESSRFRVRCWRIAPE
jgi:hypothetical protein